MSGAVDVHAHLPVAVGPQTGPPPPWDVDERLAVMDELGIEIQLLSVPHLFGADSPDPVAAARATNQHLAELVGSAPERLGAFATVPGHDPVAMVQEAEYGWDQLGLDGIALTTNAGGHHLGSPHFADLLTFAEARAIPVFVHPALDPRSTTLLLGRAPFLLEYPMDTARSLVDAILSGALATRPDLVLIAAHCGGALPALAWRLQHLAALAAAPADQVSDPDQICATLERLYWDLALCGHPTLLAAVTALAPADRLLYGSDLGAASQDTVRQNRHGIDAYPMSTAARNQVLRANAATLFRRLTS